MNIEKYILKHKGVIDYAFHYKKQRYFYIIFGKKVFIFPCELYKERTNLSEKEQYVPVVIRAIRLAKKHKSFHVIDKSNIAEEGRQIKELFIVDLISDMKLIPKKYWKNESAKS